MTRLPLALLLALGALQASAQESALPGRLLERDATTGADTSQHVAAYWPSRYDHAAGAPVVFVMDPRGRALLGLHLFAGAAERLNWVVISSYNSRSDSLDQLNVDALNAMLRWAQANVRLDKKRLYLATFSGTSREAWALAAELRGFVAGIFGSGGAPPFYGGGPEMVFGGDSTFAFFGAAGTGDFNYREMRGFDKRLRTAGIPSRIVWFSGPHSWPPRQQCEEGLEWLELRAMLGGRRPVDTAFVAAAFRRDLAFADSLARVGRWDAAETRYREVARDAHGRAEGTAALAKADALLAKAELRSLRERMRKSDEQEDAELSAEFSVLAAARTSPQPTAPDAQLAKLDVKGLQRRMTSPDSVEAEAAARLYGNLQAQLGFYEPRAFLAAGQPERAAMALRAAATLEVTGRDFCRLVQLTSAQLPPAVAESLPRCG